MCSFSAVCPACVLLQRDSVATRAPPAEAPNTVISHSVAVAAVLACDKRAPCLYTDSPELAAAEFSETVRMHMSKYKEVLKNSATRRLVRSQATGSVVRWYRRTSSFSCNFNFL